MAESKNLKTKSNPPKEAKKPGDANSLTTSVGNETASRVDEVYNGILLKIINGEILSGTELKSTQLATQMNVSRTPVIQALAKLTADGIITQERNYRAVVRPGAENWLVEIHELRLLLEPYAAEHAASKITKETLAQLDAIAEEAKPNETSSWVPQARKFDYALHLTIADCCGNLAIGQSIRKCWEYKKLSYDFGSDTPQIIEQGYQEHLTILEALHAGDSAVAKEGMQDHLQTASKYRSSERIV